MIASMELEDAPGVVIAGRYALVERAGAGGMATVWRAVSRGAAGFERPVAVKRILDSLSNDESFVRMFVEEARVGSHLVHPNIVQVLDFGLDERGHYLVMEWVEGLDLATWVRSFVDHGERTPWPLVAGIGIEMLRALGAAHERVDALGQPAPVFHRDVAPQNVLLAQTGVVKVCDFGLARAMDRVRITQPNVVKGKVSYLAPEMTLGRPASAQTDLFAVGIVFWEALTGVRLFDGRNDAAVVMLVREARVPPLTDARPDVPAALAAIVHRALDRYPSARFDSAQDMARGLADALRGTDARADTSAVGRSVVEARRRLRLAGAGDPDPVDSDPIIELEDRKIR